MSIQSTWATRARKQAHAVAFWQCEAPKDAAALCRSMRRWFADAYTTYLTNCKRYDKAPCARDDAFAQWEAAWREVLPETGVVA